MENSTAIQFDSPSCGHHGPYTFYRSFSYRRNVGQEKRSIAIGGFFFVRILAELPVCIAELQLLWESQRTVGTKLASVKLYFTPDDVPAGRKPHHGQDELLVADEKVVLEIGDLVKWILESPVDWFYGFQISSKSSEFAEKRLANSSPRTKNGCQRNSNIKNDTMHHSCVHPLVVVVSFPRYCRYRAMAKRLEKMNGSWLENVIVQAVGGMSATGADAWLMFCQETFEHPVLTFHDFRKDRLAPKLKGRKRRKNFSRQESVESVDSDAGVEKRVATTVDNAQFKLTVKRSTKFGLTLPQFGLELINSGKETFEQRLYKFMRERNTPIKRIPSLGFKEVDLFQFFMYSQKYGGYDKVTEDRHWKHIYDQMGGHPGNTSAATCTRRIYEKLLLTFERHVRGEDDRPLPVTYMRPARKKLQDQSDFPDIQNKPVLSCTADISTSSDVLSADQDIDMPNKITELETGTLAETKTCREVLNEPKIDDIDCSHTALGHHGFEASREKSPHPNCVAKSNSSVIGELKCRKDNSLLEAAIPVSTSELSSTSILNVGTSCQMTDNTDSSHGPSPTMSIFCTESVPRFKGDKILPVSLLTSKQFDPTNSSSSRPYLTKVPVNGSLESPKIFSIEDATSTIKCTGTAMGMSNSQLPTEQNCIFKECTIVSPECIPSFMRLTSPLARTGLTFIRPTYGPPNLINSPAVLTNGHNEVVSSKSLTFERPLLPAQNVFCANSTGIQSDGAKTLVFKESREKTPPGKCEVVETSGSWFNSPIKQFLDRTRAISSTLRLSDADDQPVDLSMKSLNVLGRTASHLSFMSGLHKEQEEPLNLSKKNKHCDLRHGVKVKALTTKVVVPAKKPIMSSGDAGKVIMPVSDQFVPLILSVPSLSVAAPHSVVVSNVPSLSLATLPNKAPIMKSGFSTVPTVIPTSPFPTSLIGATIRPVLQFFPSPSIALSSETGRPFLLRFPLPMPVQAPVPATQASLLVPKTNHS